MVASSFTWYVTLDSQSSSTWQKAYEESLSNLAFLSGFCYNITL